MSGDGAQVASISMLLRFTRSNGSDSLRAHGTWRNIALACRGLRDFVCRIQNNVASCIIGELVLAPDFEAGYDPELRKLTSRIPDTEFAEIEELLLCTEQGGENFYVWALLRLAFVQCKYISGLSALTPEQNRIRVP